MTNWLRVGLCFSAITITLGDGRRSQGAVAQGAATDAATHDGRIGRLIDQLGSDQYVERRRAEAELVELGADAFDALQAAERHPDLEIATRAEYLLHRIRIEWIRPNDPPSVRRVIGGYGKLSLLERRQRIEQLAALPKRAGWGALARIARFDSSQRLARLAALAIMMSPKQALSQRIDAVVSEIGDSKRVAVVWLSVYVDQRRSPDGLDSRWMALIDAEIERLVEGAEDNELVSVFRLLRFHLDLSLRMSDPEAIFATLRRRTDLYVQQQRADQHAALENSLAWILKHDQWRALELLEDHYADALRDDRDLIYFLGVARGRQGRDALAEEFAERAFQLQADEIGQRGRIASILAELGRHDWAEREWRAVVDSLPVTDARSIDARREIASLCLHDRGEDLEAAELLDESWQAVHDDANLRRTLLADPRSLALLNTIDSLREYYRACHAESEGNFDLQRDHLEKALKRNPIDADVLIAMYRLEEADEAYRNKVRKRIRKTSDILENVLKQNPQDANSYNHWAWLISNTEGDFEKAVKYSLKSLQLNPDSPSYLDTLGRCYYSVGDLENALKYQRQAVARYPQMRVIRHQLELFERENEAADP